MATNFFAIMLNDEKDKDLEWWPLRYKTNSVEQADWDEIDDVESLERQNPDRRPRDNYDIIQVMTGDKEYRLLSHPGEPTSTGRIYKMVKHT
ncbi:MAG: hypothetical protein IH964_12190 [Candidatus Dadabacteria bacterium]|nr:hypothetical protein [Candidatus Dadabacteria bacterium]